MNKSLEQYMPDGSKLPYRFMKYRIHKILLVCCSYDGYILEEDGHIESQINQEYIDLNMSNPPSLTRVSSTAEALEALDRDDSFDFILTMYNVGEPDVFSFAKIVKERHPNTPVALLTSFSKDIYRRIEEQDRSGLDYIFSWHGNTELIIAIIKLIEDKMNADEDIREGGVQAILLVEDSIRFYSTYLPEIYKLLLLQNTEFLKDAFNEQQQVLRKRARPKILLARCYEEAVELYERYKKNLLGVISDVGFVLRRNDPPESEKLDAGIDLCRRIREDNPLMPVLLQSSQVAFGKQAAELGAGFIAKNSKTLLSQLHDYIAKEFAFGDFVFKDPDTGAEIGRAKDLTQMQQMIATIPDRAFEYHTSQNHLSKWLYSRGLFPLASSIRQYNKSHFSSVEEHRRVLVGLIRDYRTLLGQGVVARFDTETYSDAVAFARIGEGSLGGKARGLAFMNSMLMKHRQYDKHENVRIMIPRSVVIATEFFDDFIRHNGLKYIISQDFSDEEILSEFVSSVLPFRLREALKSYIRTVRTPLAIRSSSKLEDSHYQPFAGIYNTYMIPYLDDKYEMLRMLSDAIKGVYASVYFRDSKAYMQATSNVIDQEKMAVILQEVVGNQYGDRYYPSMSGVARSLNYYPIGDEKAEEGIVNLALGLGKYIVDGGMTLRFSPYHPNQVLQTSEMEIALKETQTRFYALDLRNAGHDFSIDDGFNLLKLHVKEAEKDGALNYIASTYDPYDQIIRDGLYPGGRKVITFANILQHDVFPLPRILQLALKYGEQEMRRPVEIEFAATMSREKDKTGTFYLLQIRPIVDTKEMLDEDLTAIPDDQVLLRSNNSLGHGIMNEIHDIIYVKTDDYSASHNQEIAWEIEKLNQQFLDEGRNYVLVGPGRWGSSDTWLGIPVKWPHISAARVIVEAGLTNYRVDPSQGTHFFQNLTSFGVGYFTINAFMNDGVYNQEFLNAQPAVHETKYLRHVHFRQPMVVKMDGKKKLGVVLMPEE